jgi:5-methylcytosine-specific restriction endonuclease McrA
MRRIKSKSPEERRPEIDHRIPISKGGSPLSINLDGLDCLCYSCHKKKTKVDLSGKRK